MNNKKKIKILLLILVILVLVIILFVLLFNKKKEYKYEFYNYLTKKQVNYLEKQPDVYFDNIEISENDNFIIDDNMKINNSSKVKEKHVTKQLEVSNMQIFMFRHYCIIEFDIKNVSKSDMNKEMYVLTVFNENGENRVKIPFGLDKELKVGESQKKVIMYLEDVTNIYDYEIKYYKDY